MGDLAQNLIMTSRSSEPPPLILTRGEFERLVEEALSEIPREFLDLVSNIAISVEDEPTGEDLADADAEGETELLGIFRGIATTDQSWSLSGELPGEVVLFRGPFLRTCSSREEIIEEVRDTVVHELGHYFGLGDHEMPY
jgi:predicted Zn-dependent protease with MMP-like domain